MPHEEPRLEATLAGFDIRLPRVDPFAGVTPAKMAPKTRAVCPLYDTRRVKIAKSPVVVWNVQRPPALR